MATNLYSEMEQSSINQWIKLMSWFIPNWKWLWAIHFWEFHFYKKYVLKLKTLTHWIFNFSILRNLQKLFFTLKIIIIVAIKYTNYSTKTVISVYWIWLYQFFKALLFEKLIIISSRDFSKASSSEKYSKTFSEIFFLNLTF